MASSDSEDSDDEEEEEEVGNETMNTTLTEGISQPLIQLAYVALFTVL